MIGNVIARAADLMDESDRPVDAALLRTHQAVKAGLMSEAASWVSVAFTLARSERLVAANGFMTELDAAEPVGAPPSRYKSESRSNFNAVLKGI